MERRKFILGTGVVVALWMTIFSGLVGGTAGYFLARHFNSPTTTSLTSASGKTIQVTSEESAVINVVKNSSPAVVSIIVNGVNPLSGNLAQQGAGTGFIVQSNGVIVTNSHVVSDATSVFTVVTKDKKTYTAKSISRDPVNDVAVLRIDATNLPTVSLGDSSALQVGQSVVAIGNALGQFDNTVTTGVVSGLGRGITASDQLGTSGESLAGLIQTSAAINPGNSGGPLLNLSGDVIGINTATAQQAQNIGFAVPSNTVQSILNNYLKNGTIIRPFLGVSTSLIAQDVASVNNVPVGALVITVVDGSAAQKAGIQVNDIITAVNGKAINENFPLAQAVSQHNIGDTIQLTIWRGGNTSTVKATLQKAPQS